MRYEKSKSENGNASFPLETWPNWNKIANSRLNMLKPRTTGPYHKSLQTFSNFFFSFSSVVTSLR